MDRSQVCIATVSWDSHREQLLEVRTTVFVDEQKVPASIEVDEFDPVSTHLLATESETGKPIGTARLLPDGKVGRVAVLKNWRKKGLGRMLMEQIIDLAEKQGHKQLTLHGQTRTVGFYQSLGFECEGDEFEEAGIPHYKMRRVSG